MEAARSAAGGEEGMSGGQKYRDSERKDSPQLDNRVDCKAWNKAERVQQAGGCHEHTLGFCYRSGAEEAQRAGGTEDQGSRNLRRQIQGSQPPDGCCLLAAGPNCPLPLPLAGWEMETLAAVARFGALGEGEEEEAS